jgi:hypothetical protein
MSRMDLVGVEAGGLAKRRNPYIFWLRLLSNQTQTILGNPGLPAFHDVCSLWRWKCVQWLSAAFNASKWLYSYKEMMCFLLSPGLRVLGGQGLNTK